MDWITDACTPIGVVGDKIGNSILPFLWARQLEKENDTAAPEHRETRFPSSETKKGRTS
jgi:hypothetical protein